MPDEIRTTLRGRALLADPRLNKGTAFTDEERRALGLEGLLPDAVETISEQLGRVREEIARLHDDLEKHVYVRALQDHNEVLHHRLLVEDLEQMLPLVYTPTVGTATQEFSRIFRHPRGLFLTYSRRDRLRQQVADIDGEVDVIVVTDGQRILGLGDQGVGGLGIPIGKLALYSALGGIDPARTLPVVLDVGTDRDELRADGCYLGARMPRVTGDDYDAFVRDAIDALADRFPGVLIQFEDFAQHNASRLLVEHRDRVLSFNDDIQGTAAVTLAAVSSGARLSGLPLRDQRIMVVGAGSAGTGIASMLVGALAEQGVAEPLRQLFLVDRKGVLHTECGRLEPHQVPLAHPTEDLLSWGGTAEDLPLAQIVEGSGATVMIGVTGQPGLFTEAACRALAQNAERPVVLPLSNPTSRAEAIPADILAWTEGAALVGTGSPFDPVTHDGTTHHIAQTNNAYVFPGLGLGVVAVGASRVSDGMLVAAAAAVADPELCQDALLPPLRDVPRISMGIARTVARAARDEGLTDPMDDDAIDEAIERTRWHPDYPRIAVA